MDHTKFIKITDTDGDRFIINIDKIYAIAHLKEKDKPYWVRLSDGFGIQITKEQFEEFWG